MRIERAIRTMTVMKLMAVAVMLAACGGSNLRRSNLGGLALAETTTACDAGQTLWAMNRGGYNEQNMLLGDRPSSGLVIGYMATAMLATAAGWALLSDDSRPVVWSAVTGIEAKQVLDNRMQGVPLCGL